MINMICAISETLCGNCHAAFLLIVNNKHLILVALVRIKLKLIILFQVSHHVGIQRNSPEKRTRVFVKLLVSVLGILAEFHLQLPELVKKVTIIVPKSTRKFTESDKEFTPRMERYVHTLIVIPCFKLKYFQMMIFRSQKDYEPL